jgi:AI-2 transport protein TqsA
MPSGPEHRTNPAPRSDADRPTARLVLLSVIAVVLVGWALHMTASVVIPVVFSVFLALLVGPVDRWVADRVSDGFKWLGHLAAMTAILLAVAVFVGSLWIAAQQVVSRFPAASEDIGRLLGQDGNASDAGAGGATATSAPSPQDGGGFVSDLSEMVSGAGGALGETLIGWASGFAGTVVSSTGTTVAAAVLVLFLTLLMLIEAPRWRQKLSSVQSRGAERDTFQALGVIAARLRGYVIARAFLGLATGALYAAWLWLFGVDLLIVWALLTFVLNFVPTIGSLISGILPVVYAFVQKDFGTAAMAGVGILVIEQVMGNFVDPRVQGKRVALSPLVVLVVLLLWGWIWGIAGAVLAVPVTVAIVIVCAHVPALRPLALLLSSERDMEGLDRMTRSDRA